MPSFETVFLFFDEVLKCVSEFYLKFQFIWESDLNTFYRNKIFKVSNIFPLIWKINRIKIPCKIHMQETFLSLNAEIWEKQVIIHSSIGKIQPKGA